MIDPCCGSGHFLVAVFLMLVATRMEMEGLSARDACDAVLRDNIHGLEIAQRCVELAAFALALTAWRYPGEDGKAIGYRPLPELKPVLGLPADHKYYCMLFGVPAIRFARTVQRDDAAVVKRVTL